MIRECNNIFLGSDVTFYDDGNHAAIASKIDAVSGDSHSTIAQMHEQSGQSWGSNGAKDDFRHYDKSDVGCGSNVVLSDYRDFLVISSDDDN